MRRIERTGAFLRDFKREKRGQQRRDIDSLVSDLVTLLAEDKVLPEKNCDHGLSGDWRDHRECHLKPDLLLIYRKPMRRSCNSCGWVRTVSFSVNDEGFALRNQHP